jgi:hypothetical protein
MPAYEQLPGPLNLAFRASDSFSSLIDFSIDMTGYSASAALYSTITGSTVTALTTTVTNASAGQVNVSLTKTQTAGLPVGTYGWRLLWTDAGGAQRTGLTGFAEVTR